MAVSGLCGRNAAETDYFIQGIHARSILISYLAQGENPHRRHAKAQGALIDGMNAGVADEVSCPALQSLVTLHHSSGTLNE